MKNPFAALTDQAALLKTQMDAIKVTSRNQTELLRENVEILKKQSYVLERWALAAETQTGILQGILEEMQKEKGLVLEKPE